MPVSIYLKRNWGGEYENVSILVAVGVAGDGYREVLGTQESMKEDKVSWKSFFKWLKSQGPEGVRLVVGDKYPGMSERLNHEIRRRTRVVEPSHMENRR